MKKKILVLSLVLAMVASVLSPAAMAQTASESLPLTIVTSESTPTSESSSVSESTSTSESVATSESTATSESVSAAQNSPLQEGEIAIDETNFPDVNFRAYVSGFDRDKNGVFSQTELDAVQLIDASQRNIQSLKGVEYFGSLVMLTVSNNQLTELDVSQNILLEWLVANDNDLTTVDLSQNTKLKHLGLGANQLTSLDITANTALEYLSLSENQLAELDISQNTALTNLSVLSNQLTALDLSHNAQLKELYVGYNALEQLDVSKNLALTSLNATNNRLSSIDVSQNTALMHLGVDSNLLTQIDLSTNTKLISLTLSDNQLTQLDVSANPELFSLFVDKNELKALDLTHNTKLTQLDVHANQLSILDLTANTAVTMLDVTQNPLFYLKLGSNLSTPLSDTPSNITLEEMSGAGVDLTAYAPGLDSTKVMNLQGAKINDSGVLTDWVSGSPISYTYDAGFGQMLNVIVTVTAKDAHELSLSAEPLIKAYDGKPVTENEILAGAKALYNGKEVAGQWSVQDFTQVKDAGTYRFTLQFQPDEEAYEASSIETVVKIDTVPLVIYPLLSSNWVTTTQTLPTVSLGSYGSVNGETLVPTIAPIFNGMPQKMAQGYYKITLSNAAELVADLQAQPVGKNYTITALQSSDLYIANMITLPSPNLNLPGMTSRLDMEKTFTNVPDSLKAIGLDTPEKVTEKLLVSTQGANASNAVVYDVHCIVSEDNQTWKPLTAEQFPKEGMTITLPYPQGVDTTANDFTAMHMFTQDMNGFKTGDVEVLSAVKTAQGLQITVKGFSPIAITWKVSANPTPPTDGGIVTPPTVPTTPTTTGPIAQTGDNSQIALWAVLMVVCAAGIAGLVFVRIKNQKK